MLSNKQILFFFLKAGIVYGFLFLPLDVYDQGYERFYRSCNTFLFSNIQADGHVRFSKGKEPALTHLNIWNQKQVKPDGKVDSAKADVNTRYRGYLPTILFLSLLLASPIPWRRKIFAFIIGFLLVTGFVMFKAWLGLIYVCQSNSWLDLVHFSGFKNQLLDLTTRIFFHSTGSILYFVVAIWIIVTFRRDDLHRLGKILVASGHEKEKTSAPVKHPTPLSRATLLKRKKPHP